jgi:hypothetical protein
VTDLLPLLQDFYREKLTMFLRHQAAARLVGGYDANNTYQYIINREDVQLTWIAKAIEELSGTVPDVADQPPARRPPRPTRSSTRMAATRRPSSIGGARAST